MSPFLLFASFYCFVSISCIESDLDRMVERFRREAPVAWRKHLELMRKSSSVSVELESRRFESEYDRAGVVEYSFQSLVVRRNGEFLSRWNPSQHESGGVQCVNRAYSFELEQQAPSQSWRLCNLVESEREYLGGIPNKVRQATFAPNPNCIGRVPLPEIIELECFKWTSFKVDEIGGSTLLAADFEIELGSLPSELYSNPIKRGTIWFTPEMYWVPIRSSIFFRYQVVEDDYRLELFETQFVYEDEQGPGGFPRLKRRSYRVNQRDGSGYHRVSYDFKWKGLQLPSGEEFQLAFYGIPEPTLGTRHSIGFPWWINGLIGGVCCVLLGLVIKRINWLRFSL